MIVLPRRRLLRLAAAAGVLARPAIVDAANIRRARFPATWRPNQVPRGMQCAIDRSHPLGRAVLCAYAPGTKNGWTDIAGAGPALSPRTNGNLVMTPVGPANNGAGSNPTGAFSVTRPTRLEQTTALSIGWYGVVVSTHTSQPAPLFGMGDSSGSPFYSYEVGIEPGASATLCAMYNNAGSFTVNDSSAAFTIGALASCVATFPMAGATGNFYLNGVAAGTYTNAGTPTFGATNQLIFAANGFDNTRIVDANGALGIMWNGLLPADLAAWFALEPFVMMRPLTLNDRAKVVPGSGGGMLTLGVGQ